MSGAQVRGQESKREDVSHGEEPRNNMTGTIPRGQRRRGERRRWKQLGTFLKSEKNTWESLRRGKEGRDGEGIRPETIASAYTY